MVNKAQCKPGHTPTITQLAISRARDRNQTQVYWPQSTMLSQTWKLREQGVSLCLVMINPTPENTVAVHVLCDHLPCELGKLQSSPCPGSMIFLCLGRQAGRGQRHPSCCHTSSIILFSNNWLWLPQQTCPPRRPCSGLFWWTAGLASPTVCRKTGVSHPSCLLSPPSTSQCHGVQACCLLCLLVCFLLHFPKHGFLSGWKHRRLLPIRTCRALVLGDFQEVGGGGWLMMMVVVVTVIMKVSTDQAAQHRSWEIHQRTIYLGDY